MTAEIDCLSIATACNHAFSRAYSFDVAARYGELTAASQAGLISDEWREAVPDLDVQSFLDRHRPEIDTEWRKEFDRLKRIIDFGGSLGYEEMMQVLTLRSELEFCKHFVTEECLERLRSFDKEFPHAIARNRQVQGQCAGKVKSGVCRILESHWWWP